MNSIYLDNAATTPLHPAVLEAMMPHMTGQYGNPSSLHSFGRAAKTALSGARDQIADQLRCSPSEIVFTSGGTESDNMALFGVAAAVRGNKNHIVTSQVEHHAVLHACEQLERLGYTVTYVQVDPTGRIQMEQLLNAIRPETCLISVMYGNNEVGTLQPVEQIGLLARERNILFHVDAVQALGTVAVDLSALPVDLMSFSAHKINGPKGVGALYMSRNVPIQPTLFGGTQERKRRAGTENVAGIVGFAAALHIAAQHMEEKQQKLDSLRQLMIQTFEQQLGQGQFVVNGHPTERLPHILNVSFPGVGTETMLMNLDLEGVCAASGSACTSGSLEVSHVLQAMNLPEEVTSSAIRFSFGVQNTPEEAVIAAQKTATIVNRLRNKQ